jgi:DNA-binding transcriptional ArsR family regulator
MTLKVPPELAVLFGSETRVRVLAPLANASRPLTAYRVATLSGVARSKINAEIRRLEKAGIVRSLRIGKGRSGWELIDPDLGNLVRRRLRIVWSEDLEAEAPRLVELVRASRSRREPIDKRLLQGSVRNSGDYVRPPKKDRILRRLGLRPSVREKR